MAWYYTPLSSLKPTWRIGRKHLQIEESMSEFETPPIYIHVLPDRFQAPITPDSEWTIVYTYIVEDGLSGTWYSTLMRYLIMITRLKLYIHDQYEI